MAIVNKGRQAKTDFIRLARFDAGDLLRAHLHSGRTHQIRVHLASVGHPVMGDDVYGGGGGRRVAGLPPKRHFLHAAWLEFNHPMTGEPMDFRSPLARRSATLALRHRGRARAARAVDPLSRSVSMSEAVTAPTGGKSPKKEPQVPTRRLLVFEVGGSAFACEMESFREIVTPHPMTRLPGRPRYGLRADQSARHHRHGDRWRGCSGNSRHTFAPRG